jgi:excinuclease ABC subunit C
MLYKKEYKKLPNKPGCYLYKDKFKNIIYIGKAKNLKKRVSSYFLKKDLDIKTKLLVENIEYIDYIITNNEIEALLLENNLIKKHTPKYNIDLKDSSGYAYLKLTNEKYPRLVIYRGKKDSKNVFGPFINSEYRRIIQKFINKNFKLRTCKKLPKRACVRYHLNHCLAPCINKISEEEYNENIKQVKSILKGKTKEVLKDLNYKLNKNIETKNFESAIFLRDKIKAIKYLEEKQIAERKDKYNEDIINYIKKNNKLYFMIFNVDKGILINKKEYTIDTNSLESITKENTEDYLDDFIIKYYSNNKSKIPNYLILPKKLNKITTTYLKKINNNKKVNIIVPQKGEKKILLDLVYKNIENKFLLNINILKNLKEELNLKYTPYIAECFDISHLGGTNIVASSVQFKDGKENKKEYRRYKLRTVKDNDDFASMREVINRRYSRLLKEHKGLPNLIIIDGGKGQLSIAQEVLRKLNILDKVDLISIAKKEELIYKIDNLFPYKLSKKSKELQFIQRIRDEAHRFAITYQKLLRSKDLKLKK